MLQWKLILVRWNLYEADTPVTSVCLIQGVHSKQVQYVVQ